MEVAGGCGGTFSVGVKKSKNGFISLQPMNDKGSYPLQPDCRVYIVVDPGVKVGLSKIVSLMKQLITHLAWCKFSFPIKNKFNLDWNYCSLL